jgi:hypothetical protein
MWLFDGDTREGSDFNFLTSIKNFEVYNHNKCQRKRKEKKTFLIFFRDKISSSYIEEDANILTQNLDGANSTTSEFTTTYNASF